MHSKDNNDRFDANNNYKIMMFPIGSTNNPILPYSFPSLEDKYDKEHKYD